jgi:hypothetical protein
VEEVVRSAGRVALAALVIVCTGAAVVLSLYSERGDWLMVAATIGLVAVSELTGAG